MVWMHQNPGDSNLIDSNSTQRIAYVTERLPQLTSTPVICMEKSSTS
ncbi:MAG: hypothetical protein PHO08_03680 [Methylococcales bacterium]|nr:hypothetical protein [Methylococcales bacterium]